MSDFAPCPKCSSPYVYPDQDNLICPECAYEWNPNQAVAEDDDEVKTYKDSVGNALEEGDRVTLVKDLKVKGSSQVLKVGTKAKINRFVDGDHDIDCKVDGVGPMMLKTSVVKKA